jgi:transposase
MLECKQEAVRLVESGQTMAAAARSLGVVEQSLGNCIKSGRDVEGSQRQAAGNRRTDGDQAPAGGVGACHDGARHSGKSDGILRKGPE